MQFEISEYTNPRLLRLMAKFINDVADLAETDSPNQKTANVEAAPSEDPAPTRKKRSAKAAETTSKEEESAETVSGSDTEASSEQRTLVEVRAVLAEKSKAGKSAEVKALIAEYGVTMLTQVPEDKLTELYNKGEAL